MQRPFLPFIHFPLSCKIPVLYHNQDIDIDIVKRRTFLSPQGPPEDTALLSRAHTPALL